MSFRSYTALSVTALSIGLGFAFGGCSSDDTSNPGPGPQDGGQDTNTTGTTQRGKVVDFPGEEGVEGATVTIGSKTATTGADGKYTIEVTKNAPFFMKVSKTGYTTLLEQEWQLSESTDRGNSNLVSSILTGSLISQLDKIAKKQGGESAKVDTNLGVLAVSLIPVPGCDIGGATVKLDGMSDDAGADAGAAATRVGYFTGASPLPSETAISATSGQLAPTAVIFNIPPSNDVKVVVTLDPAKAPGCKQNTDFPVADPTAQNIKFTGKVKVEAAAPSADVRQTSVARFLIVK